MSDYQPQPFRCIGCGAVARFATRFRTHRLTDHAACDVCGGRAWARCDTFTEYLAYGKRDDVCQLGDHIDPHARPYTVYARDRPREDPLVVRVCPSHHVQLYRDGFLGFFPRDDDP